MSQAFSSDDCDLLAQALGFAWDICREAGTLESRDMEQAKAVLTRGVLTGFESGERNARRLAIMAAADLDEAPNMPVAGTRTADSAA